MSKWAENEEIKIFQEYLQIPSVHPDINYEPCIKFLEKQADNLGLPIRVYHPADPKKPVVIITWLGTEPTQPSIILNSHMDVVPVFPDNWSHPPFGAEIDDAGRIYARGAQDMKCIGVQYLAAVRQLIKNDIKLKRTIHITFVPDEEIGGFLGMKEFVKTDDFKALNVGFSLDEGLASANDTYPIYFGERSIWRIHFKCFGTAGHGSLLHKNTAGEKIRFIVDQFMDMREHEVKKLKNNPHLTIGDVTTVNLTIMDGGVQSNVVPPSLLVAFDVRIAADLNMIDFEAKIDRWCEEAGGGIEIIWEQKDPQVKNTTIDNTNPFWVALNSALVEDLQLKIKPSIFPGGTDSRYIREIGIPAIGFSPMKNTPILLHDHDEYLDADTFLEGIEIYKTLIPKLGNA